MISKFLSKLKSILFKSAVTPETPLKIEKKYSLKVGVLTFEPIPKFFFNKALRNFRISYEGS